MFGTDEAFLPLIEALQQAGFPVGGGWDEMSLPEIADPHAYGLEIAGDSMEPVLRDGDTVILRGYAEKNGVRIGLGEVSGTVLPAAE